MSGISINVTLNPSGKDKSGKFNGNEKHERFLKKKQYLMRKGLLKDKQNRRKNWRSKKQSHTQINGEEQSKAGAIFPKFNTTVPHTSTSFISTQTFCQKSSTSVSSTACTSQGKPTKKMVPPISGPLKYVAMDCEMVGTGPKGSIGELGRCSIVSYNGDVIYDKFVKPTNPVTDFRTRWSGIRRHDLHYATPFQQAQKEIIKIMTGKVVVGHAIHNDFKALKYFHPACQTRDTTKIPLLNQRAGFPEHEPASLKRLTKALFNKDIQTGKRGHSSVEDAKATMELYKVVEVEWERKLASEAIS